MSGLRIYSSTAVVVGCAGLLYGYGVCDVPQGECVDWCKWTLLPLQYTTLFVECQLVPNMVLCALGHVY